MSGYIGTSLGEVTRRCLKSQSHAWALCVFYREAPEDQKKEGPTPGKRGPGATQR
jgi:hypothetical protein